jgi:hypothetical protein
MEDGFLRVMSIYGGITGKTQSGSNEVRPISGLESAPPEGRKQDSPGQRPGLANKKSMVALKGRYK